jgi:hypothetical protein
MTVIISVKGNKKTCFSSLYRASCLVLFCLSFGLFRPAPAVWHLARQVCTVFCLF